MTYLWTKKELSNSIKNREEIVGFTWGFEVAESVLDSLVPVWFPFSSIIVDDESEQKTWREYWIIFKSTNSGKVLIKISEYINESRCNNWPISSERLYEWIDALWESNIKIKTDFDKLKKIEEMI